MDGMTSSEYQQWYDYGWLPERFWDREIAKFTTFYVLDLITLEEFEDELHDLMGFGRYRHRNTLPT